MLRIVPGILSLAHHLKTLAILPELYRPERCPHCGLAGLWGHGRYPRKADRARGAPNLIPIPRFLCGRKGGCGGSCSSVPECLAPRRWWDWVKQAMVLSVLLGGASIRAAAAHTRRARSTVRRWWGWLSAQHARYAFHLLTHFPEWGRTSTWQEFWQRALQEHSLAALMRALDAEGLVVP